MAAAISASVGIGEVFIETEGIEFAKAEIAAALRNDRRRNGLQLAPHDTWVVTTNVMIPF